MKVLGIEFAPLHIPKERRLQTLAAAAWFIVLAFGGFLGTLLLLSIFFTRFWWLALLYVGWIYLDRFASETGGRPKDWMKKWAWWYYLKEYFPTRLELPPNYTFDIKRNYLFSCFPHGILPAGPFTTIHGPYSDFFKSYPNFKVFVAILGQQFNMPFARELGLGMGCVSVSGNSLNYLLSRSEGGNVVLLMPGGAAEAYNSRPGQYKFVVKDRKGFVKLAIKNGSPLVPVISFGEPDLFRQIEGATLKKVQERIRKIIGLAPVIFSGRGFFQYSFGIIPRRKPIVTVVGTPINIQKNENPTNEEVNEIHAKFLKELENLFEVYKHKYLKNPEERHLVLE